MKKIISLLLTIGMLATLFVVPVSAETVNLVAYVDKCVLGEGTALTADGQHAIFDEVGDSVSYTFEIDEAAVYDLQATLTGTSAVKRQIAPGCYVDGVLVGTGFHRSNYYPINDDGTPKTSNFGIGSVWLEAGRHTVKVENLIGAYNLQGIRIYTSTKTKAELSADFTTYAGLGDKAFTSSNADNSYALPYGGTYPAYFIMNDTTGTKSESHVKIGIKEAGIYSVKTKAIYGNMATDNYFKLTSTLNGATNQVTMPAKDADYTLIENVALTPGTYVLDIVKSGNYGYYGAIDTITVTKTGDIEASASSVEKTFTAANTFEYTGGAKVFYTYWTLFSAAGQTASYKINIPADGNYRLTVNWDAGAVGTTPYWGALIDGMEVITVAETDNSDKGGPCLAGSSGEDTNQPVSDCGIIPLTAGEHLLTIRFYGGATFYANKATFTKVNEGGALKVEAEGFVEETSSDLTKDFGGGSTAMKAGFPAGKYGHYTVVAPANGFYSVGASLYTYATGGILDVEANGTVALFRDGASEEAAFVTTTASGDIYLNKGANDVKVISTGAHGCSADYFTFTPVAWADRAPGVKAAALYAGENVATAITANTEYTAVADIAGGYLGKPVTLMVGVYAGGKLVAAHKAEGTTALGQTIEKTFTTPEAAGDYTVKVFMFDGLSTLKPYTTTATVVNPAVAEAE